MSEGLRDVAHKQASSKSLKFILRVCKDPMGLIGFDCYLFCDYCNSG